MRLWHQALIPYLDNRRLLGQHRECCALRGKGWGRKHATVDYVFKYSKIPLICYHQLVINEMERRGYIVDARWKNPYYNGKKLGYDHADVLNKEYCVNKFVHEPVHHMIFREHNHEYLVECIKLLKQKQAPMDFEKIEEELL